MMTWRLIFSVDVGGKVGFGHFNRCVAIGLRAQESGASVALDVRGDVETGRVVAASVGLGFCNAENDHIDARHPVVVIDRVHADVLNNPDALYADMSNWRSQGIRTALIDGTGEASLRRHRGLPPCDVLVAPYAGEAELKETPRSLTGPKFAPLRSEYQGLPSRVPREAADRVLVTCGGSDPFRISEKILLGLESIDKTLVVRMILGPGFVPDYRLSLTGLATNSRHTIEAADAPDCLAESMLWCDVAIATSGLTKYELAATGTPAILLSPDDAHDTANQPFAKLGTADDLGIADSALPMNTAAALPRLLADHGRRAMMARAGQHLIDGAGALRIALVLRDLAYAES